MYSINRHIEPIVSRREKNSAKRYRNKEKDPGIHLRVFFPKVIVYDRVRSIGGYMKKLRS